MLQMLCVVLFLTFYIEYMYHQDLSYTIKWFKRNPLGIGINCLLYFGIFGILYQVMPSTLSASLMMLLAYGLGLGNKYKVLYRGDNLFPWDLMLGKESSDMSGFIDKKSVTLDVMLGMIYLLFIVGLTLNVSISRSHSLIVFALALTVMVVLYVSHRKLPVIKQHEFYANNGLLLAFILNIREFNSHLGQKTIKSNSLNLVTQGIKVNTVPKSVDIERPNVIAIMSESFWDPSRMKGATFSRPLTPTLDAMRENAIYGDLVSPEFGGGTSNTEYEFLSGNNMFFHPTGTMAFQTFVHQDIDSIPLQMKMNGYKTIGLHSYKRWFWNREAAYKHMGIDTFISWEAFENPEIRGHYISDMEFSRKTIELYEATNEPLFMFGVTMQNHGPYRENRYSSYDLDVKADLSQDELGELKCYAQGVADADAALGELVTYFESKDEPVIIVFFGDHLPMLGTKFSIYDQCGYVRNANPLEWNEGEKLKMSSTPFVIWSNKDMASVDLGTVSPTRVGLELLKLMPHEMSPHFNLLNDIYEKYPVINKRVHDTVATGSTMIEDLKKYQASQMKMLYGND